MPVSEVTSANVIGILAPIWHETPATARKLRQRIRAVMEWAVAKDLRPGNPCDRIGPVLGAQGNGVRHRRALPHPEVAAAIEAVRASRARPAVKLAFEFLVLTATRSGEVSGAVWTEMDRDEGVWSIPAPRTKRNREHRVPLCRRALEILEEARALSRGSPLVFPGVGEKPIGNTPMSELLRELNVAAVPHGFRSSLRDWAPEEADHPREVIETVLAPVVRNRVEAVYARSDLFERHRVLMDGWARYLAQGIARPHQVKKRQALTILPRPGPPWRSTAVPSPPLPSLRVTGLLTRRLMVFGGLVKKGYPPAALLDKLDQALDQDQDRALYRTSRSAISVGPKTGGLCLQGPDRHHPLFDHVTDIFGYSHSKGKLGNLSITLNEQMGVRNPDAIGIHLSIRIVLGFQFIKGR